MNKRIIIICMLGLSSFAESMATTYETVSAYNVLPKALELDDSITDLDIKKIIRSKYIPLGYTNLGVEIESNRILIDDEMQSLNNITINGVSKSVEETLMVELNLSEFIFKKGFYFGGSELIQGLESMKNHFHNNGYPNVIINYRVVDGGLVIDINRGNLVRVLELQINSDLSNTALFESFYENIPFNSIYSKEKIELSLLKSKTYLDNNGYVNGSIKVDKQAISDDFVILKIKITGNKQAVIGNVVVEGWNLEDPYEYKYLKSGDIYDISLIKLEIQALVKTGLFEKVTPEIKNEGGAVHIALIVVPRKTGKIFGGASHNGENPTLTLRVSESNFLNNGYKVSTSITGNNDSLEVGFSIKPTHDYSYFLQRKKLIGEEKTIDSIGVTINPDNIEGFFYKIVGFSETCSTCLNGLGVELTIGHLWNRVDNFSDPEDGYIAKSQLKTRLKDGYTQTYSSISYDFYRKISESVFISNKSILAHSVNSNYLLDNYFSHQTRGINITNEMIEDNFTFVNKADIFGRGKILGEKFDAGFYIDSMGGQDTGQYTSGVSFKIYTGMGNLEFYKSLTSSQPEWDNKVGFLFTEKF
jgi:outer membrane protein assembly factor BamA